MDNLSKFAERLETLMFENSIDATSIAQAIGAEITTVRRYLYGQITPSVKAVIKLADIFRCTIDFLIGRESESYTNMFNDCPPFHKQLEFLHSHFGCPWCKFYQTANISQSRFYEWKNGNRVPSLDSIIALADGFDVSVDFILGRTKL